MKQMGTLYLYELKKIVNRKMVWIVGCIMAVLCVFLSFANLISTSYYGNTEVSGYEGMKQNREYARNLSGRALDDTLLSEMQDSYREEQRKESTDEGMVSGNQISVDSGGSQEEDTDAGIREYAPVYFYVQEITEDSGFTLETDMDSLYAKRESSISQNRADQMITDKELAYLSGRDAEIEIPFSYEYTEGWTNLWEYAYTINYMVLLMLSICLSGVFSVEYLRKTDAVILCSRYGKRQLYLAKMLAGVTFGILTALVLFGAAVTSNLCVYGPDGFGAALQLAFPLSSWKISVGESIFLLLFLLIIISVLYSVGILFLSEVMKNSIAVMAVPVGVMIITMMLDVPYQFRIPSQIYDLLPTNLLVKWGLWDDRLVPVFGKYLRNFQIAPVIYLFAALMLFLIGKRIYQRYQVSAR